MKGHTKNKMRKIQNLHGQTKIGRSCNAYKSHKIDLSEKMGFYHAFKNINVRCFSYLLWEIIPQSRAQIVKISVVT